MARHEAELSPFGQPREAMPKSRRKETFAARQSANRKERKKSRFVPSQRKSVLPAFALLRGERPILSAIRESTPKPSTPDLREFY